MATLPLQNQIYIFYVALVDVTDHDVWVINPTIAVGDFQVSVDGAAFVNLSTLPIVEPAGSRTVKISLSASEMNGEKVNIQGIDISDDEWQQILITLDVPTDNVETISDLEKGDRIETKNRLLINKAGTTETLLDKKITGSLLPDNVVVRFDDD